MAILKIVYTNDSRLRTPTEPIKKFDDNLSQLAADMLDTMKSLEGVGIAAPQIGVMQQLFVVDIPPFRNGKDKPIHPQSGKTYVVVNPRIVALADKMVEGREGCLSIPSWYGLVNRPEWLEIVAQDLQGKEFRLKLDDLLGRAFQHELDHLEGILFTDHIAEPTKLWQDLPDD